MKIRHAVSLLALPALCAVAGQLYVPPPQAARWFLSETADKSGADTRFDNPRKFERLEVLAI